MRGDGYIYQRGRRWWIGYYIGGRLHREPAGASKTEAKDRLKAVHQAIHKGTYLTPQDRRVTVADLLDDLQADLDARGLARADKARYHLKPVRDFVGMLNANDLTTAMLSKYQEARKTVGRKPATINRELELLRQAYRLAQRVTPPRVSRSPYVPMLKVENARQGFLGRAEYEALSAAIVDQDIRDFVAWLWWTGMRTGEARQITWAMYDRDAQTLTLDPKAAKTRRGRVCSRSRAR